MTLSDSLHATHLDAAVAELVMLAALRNVQVQVKKRSYLPLFSVIVCENSLFITGKESEVKG